jgi:uncharacterized phiE125 gp8 family phage protein
LADAALGVQAPTVNTTADPQLADLIQAARDRAEQATDRAMLTQTWDLVLDAFPDEDWIEIPKPPLVSVTSVKYLDSTGVLQTWPAANYLVEAPAGPRCRRGRLSLAYGISWPSTFGQIKDVTIRFVCGAATAAGIAPLLRQAMLLDIGTLYVNRESVLTGSREQVVEMPFGSRAIYRSYHSPATQRVHIGGVR